MCIQALLKSGLCWAPEGAQGPLYQHLTVSLAISFRYLTVVENPWLVHVGLWSPPRMYHLWPAAKPVLLEDAAGSRTFSTASTQTLTSFTCAKCEPTVIYKENRSRLELFYWRHRTCHLCNLSNICWPRATSRVEVENAKLLKKTTERS